MVFSCKGICIRYKRQGTEGGKKYQNGQKRCSNCVLYLDWLQVRYPCCKAVLRTKARY